jgi:redox-sensitive bicupin YhaK (pirin superfamily)
MDPRYRGIKKNEIPLISMPDGVTVRIICGELNGIKGPVQDVMTAPEYMDIEIPAGKTFTHLVKDNHNVFAYVIDGEAYFDHLRTPFAHDASGVNYFDMSSPCPCSDGTLILYKRQGSQISVTTDKHSVRFLLVSGKPLNEPIAWYGPIVMNTHDELRKAFQEFNDGTFVKHR